MKTKELVRKCLKPAHTPAAEKEKVLWIRALQVRADSGRDPVARDGLEQVFRAARIRAMKTQELRTTVSQNRSQHNAMWRQ